MLRSILMSAAAMLLAAPLAAQTLQVEGMVSPAWLERGGAREPLAIGTALQSGDRVYTGEGARALLRLSDDSAIKLGAHAVFSVDSIAEQRGGAVARLVSASLDVAQGAFRFTTNLFGKRRAERDIRVRIATVTAGIRGTDVWGKSADDRDIVCLIDGRITVSHAGQEFSMQEPLSFFIAPRGKPPLPVAPVLPDQLKQWAEETEIRVGGMRRGGRFDVEIAVANDQQTALAEYDRLREAGYPAEIQPQQSDYSVQYRVRIPALPSPADAEALAARLVALGFAGARAAR
ncbi:MAG: FecR domain-containing protein [Burkholderiales bacterium]|nr:FecR domain-containing protein [Burkholderiales bacterium]